MKTAGLLEVLENLNVWLKARPILGYDESVWRHDDDGNVIRFDAHGDRSSKYGWEKDHIIPVADGGTEDLSNIRPLHWLANVRRTSSRGILDYRPKTPSTLLEGILGYRPKP